MNVRSAILGVILDVDGTLVDSNDAHARAWVEAMAEYGYDASFETVRPLIGMGGDKLIPKAIHVNGEGEEGEAIDARRSELFQTKHLPHLRAFPKVRELLVYMRERGLELVVASSSKRETLEALLELAEVTDLIESSTSTDDAEASKPAPDIVGAALKRLGLPKENVVMLGDTPYDVEATRRAGISLIGLRCGGWDDEGLEGAVAVYDGPADLLAHFEGSPLASSG